MTEVNLKSLNKFIDTFRKNKAEAEAKVAQIDEEYRRLAEEKKVELNKIISSCTAELEFWEKNVLPRYTEPEAFSEPTATVEQEDVVVDTTAQEEQNDVPMDDIPEDAFVEDETKIDPSVVVEEVNIVDEMEKAKNAESQDVIEEVAETEDASVDNADDFWAEVEDPWK